MIALSEGPQDVSFKEMVRLAGISSAKVIKHRSRRRRLRDLRRRQRRPDRSTTAAPSSASSPGRERTGGNVVDFINRIRPKLQKVGGRSTSTCSRRRISASAAGSPARNTSTRCRTPISNELYDWAPKVLGQAAQPCRCCATSRPTSRSPARPRPSRIDRDAAARFGIQPQVIDDTLYDAFGQRQVTQYFLPGELVSPDPGSAGWTCSGQVATLNKLYVKSANGPGRAALDLRQVGPRLLSSRFPSAHQSQFPAVTISFNLAPGVALGDAVVAIQKAVAADRRADER